MRGLTAAEREVLLGWRVDDDVTQAEKPTLLSLLSVGRVRIDYTQDEEWRRTDMAYLALRVCPVGEP